jgi:hypothetical protein
MFKEYFSFFMLAVNVSLTLFICLITKGYERKNNERGANFKITKA